MSGITVAVICVGIAGVLFVVYALVTPFIKDNQTQPSAYLPSTQATQQLQQQSTQKQSEIYLKESTYPTRPAAPKHKNLSYALGVLLIVGACLLMLASFYGAGFKLCLLVPVLFVCGGLLIRSGARADQREAENVGARAAAKEEEIRHEKAVVDLESARNNAELQRGLNRETNITQIGEQKLRQQQITQQGEELGIRIGLVPEAQDKGIDVDNLIALKVRAATDLLDDERTRRFNKAETDKLWDEMQHWLRGANLVAQATGEQRQHLTQNFINTVNQIADTRRKRMNKDDKQRILDRLEKNLKQIEAELDGLSTGTTIQIPNGPPTQRHQSAIPQAGTDYPESVGPDDY